MPVDKERILIVTDLLLGAAHADRRFEGQEAAAVQQLLRKIATEESARAVIAERIEKFDPDVFDLRETAARFAADPVVGKRHLLELVAAVTHADDELDLSEDDYLRGLAEALGMTRDEYGDLTLDYQVEALQQALDLVINVSVPPPVPEK